jgi:parallel beta-helix repeat protein
MTVIADNLNSSKWKFHLRTKHDAKAERTRTSMRNALCLLTLFLVPFAQAENSEWQNPLRYLGKLDSPLVEVTPFVFKDRFYLLENWQKQWEFPGTKDGSMTTKDEIRIRDVKDDRVVSIPLVGHGLGMALAHEGRVYVFAGDWGTGEKWKITEIKMVSSDDLIHWTKPVVVLKAEAQEKFFNVSVCRDAEQFVLLVESNDPAWPAFTFKYFTSDDLLHWKRVPGAEYGRDKYVGGPALYYEGAHYYTLYLQSLGKGFYETRVARSKDLIQWEDAPSERPVVTFNPKNKVHPLRPEEIRETNASDLELCYWQGKTRAYYTGGDQHLAGDLQHAEYDGSLRELLERFFVKPKRAALTFHVATNGSDAWTGTEPSPASDLSDGPFATLERAVEFLRQVKKSQGGTLRQPVCILLREGTHFLAKPLYLTPEDSGTAENPVVFASYPGEQAVVSGGFLVKGWRKMDDVLWAADLPSAREVDYRCLRVNDAWATQARYPNFDPEHPRKGGWLFARQKAAPSEESGDSSDPVPAKDHLIMDAKAFPEWETWENADLHVFPAWGWVNTIVPVNGTDKAHSKLLIDSPQEIRPGNRFFIAGTRAALDSPGEWCVDKKKGQLLYWPIEEDMSKAEVVAPSMDRLIVLQGTDDAFVEHIQFNALTFMDSTYTLGHTYSPADAAIHFSGARNCNVRDSVFTCLAGYAVRMEEGSHDNVVVYNTMNRIGQGGVIMVGDTATQAHDNLIAANTMTDLGLIYKHVAGVYVTTGSGNRIAHNRIHRVPRYGISLKSFNEESYSHDNIVEYNELIDLNLETNDTGAIETLGRDRKDSGNIIRYNLIRNVVGLKTSPEGEMMSPYFTWGIYLDDYSSGTTLYGNIVDGTVIGGFCIHGGKNNRVENNIFLNASSQQLRLQPRDDFMAGNTFKNNIVAYQDPDTLLWYSYDKTWRPDRLSECDNNVYWCYGDSDIAVSDRTITPEGSYADWLKTGHDANSVVADPGFVSPERTHFGLQADSPAFALGFKTIPEDRIGPEGYQR